MEFIIYDIPYMIIDPLQLYKCLADDTRLKCLLLIQVEQELCVCELTDALQVSQPKISRHLAQLRETGLLKDRREGQWIYYQLNPALPHWATKIISITVKNNCDYIKQAHKLLKASQSQRQKQCC